MLAGRAAWRGLVSLLGGDDVTHAASVAYCGLLSLFPAFLLAFAIFGAVAAREANRAAVIEFILRYFPTRFEFVSRQLDALSQTPLRFGVAGGIALVWAAHSVFSAVTTAVNYAWKVERPRSYVKHKLFVPDACRRVRDPAGGARAGQRHRDRARRLVRDGRRR